MAYHSIYGRKIGINSDGQMEAAAGLPVKAFPKLPAYTVATVPSASTMGAGSIIYVSDGNAGGDTVAVSDGTDWLNLVAGTAVASS